ncbi:hypothetical protein J4436_04080 [Candidatus Woesearchaeota archaeon]|nr:hypothetical protein [Candidatus Woesearchaeota archaeon]
MFNKIGQKEELAGKAVMIIILVIAFLIALYILFLPPEERRDLLNQEEPTGTPKTGTTFIELFSESPGKLYPLKEYITTKNIPSIDLYTKTTIQADTLSQSLFISKSLFSNNPQTIYFSLDSQDKATLFFSLTGENSGTLRIYINNNLFFSEKISENDVKLINIPTRFLKQENSLYFEVSSPGLFFWKTNEMHLKDIGIRQEIESINIKEQRLFVFTNQEISSLKTAKLSFYQFCEKDIGGHLTILLNNMELFNANLKCINTATNIDIPKDILKNENILQFEIDKGEFSFNQVKIQTDTKEQTFPYYTFELSSTEFNKIENSTLKITMVDDGKLKSALFYLNSEKLSLKTRDVNYNFYVQDYLEYGTNYLRIEPLSPFEIISLKITAEENND